MSLNLAEKKAVVAEVTELSKSSNALVAAHYHGLTVDQMTSLRNMARKNQVGLRVIKNSLAKRAFESTDYSSFSDKLVGPMIFAFAQNEPNAAARVFRDFIKENATVDKDMVQFLWFADELHPASSLNKIASLPTKDEAISILMSCMKAPIAKLARTIAEVQKQKASEQAIPVATAAIEPEAEVKADAEPVEEVKAEA